VRFAEWVARLAAKLEITDEVLWCLLGFFGGIVFAAVVWMNFPAWLI